MREISATMTSKGQITVPAEVRKQLGLKAGDTVIFVVSAEDEVTLRVSPYPDVASVLGAAGRLPEPHSWEEIERIVDDERAEAWRSRLDPTVRQ